MSKDEAMTILWNMRADYIKANECGLATKGVISKIGSSIILNSVLSIETVIATAIVLYVLIRYMKFLSRN